MSNSKSKSTQNLNNLNLISKLLITYLKQLGIIILICITINKT